MEKLSFKTIGYRKNGIGIVYLFALILGIVLAVSGIFLATNDSLFECIMFILGGILVGVFSIIEMIEFYSTKSNVISISDENIKVNDNVFAIKDIIDVSYKKARSRYCTYNYGTITIITVNNRYTAQFVADCEIVSKKITKLMYEKKNLNN